VTAHFSRLDDEMGQKTTFITTLLTVVTTFPVGLLPTYAEIGLAAPILLSTLRILQGISLGDAYT
jgi:MHS family proline/betaine transporter-like MFS transporter